MEPGLVYEGFLIEPPECLPLVIHGIMWDFPNIQATKEGFPNISDIPGYKYPLG